MTLCFARGTRLRARWTWVERHILRPRGEGGALSRHVAFDVGEDGLELGFVADGGEMGGEVAVVAPADPPAGLLRFAQLCQGLRGVTPQRVDRDVTGRVAAPSHSRNCSKVG